MVVKSVAIGMGRLIRAIDIMETKQNRPEKAALAPACESFQPSLNVRFGFDDRFEDDRFGEQIGMHTLVDHVRVG